MFRGDSDSELSQRGTSHYASSDRSSWFIDEDESDSSCSSTRPTTPKSSAHKRTPADRKNALESLIKRRRRLSEINKHSNSIDESDEAESADSSEESASNSSDSESSSSGSSSSETSSSSDSDSSSDSGSSSCGSAASEQSLGFYTRVNASLDRKDNRRKSVSEGMTERQAFLNCVLYYAICLLNDGERPPKLKCDELDVGKTKIEKLILGRRDAVRPTYWKPRRMYVKAMESFPKMRTFKVEFHGVTSARDEACHACDRPGWSHLIEFAGKPYNSKSVWEGDIRYWMLVHRDHFRTEASKEGSLSDEEERDALLRYVNGKIEVGATCAGHAKAYHELNHLKSQMLQQISDFLRKCKISKTKDAIVLIKKENDGIVKEWFQHYRDVCAMVEGDLEKTRRDAEDDDNRVSEPSRRISGKRRSYNFMRC